MKRFDDTIANDLHVKAYASLMLIIPALFLCCNTTQEAAKIDCSTTENAVRVSNELVKREGFDINNMSIKIQDKDNEFIITYSLKDSLILGGGAEIIINKENCEVISEKLFQ